MPVFDVAKWVWNFYYDLKRSIFAQYTVIVLTDIFSFFKWIFCIIILNHKYNSQQYAWAVCDQIVDCLYKYTVFRAKNPKNRPIRPISNVHANTIGIVFASSKPIKIEYCFDDVWINCLRLNGARLNDWIYLWTIEFIQFNFPIAHRWRKDGCQQVYELGLDQLLPFLIFFYCSYLDVAIFDDTIMFEFIYICKVITSRYYPFKSSNAD